MPEYRPGTIQIRRYTSAQWAALNPVLADGELGYDTGPAPSPTAGALKVGNGYLPWSQLDTFAGPQGPEGPAGPAGAMSLALADGSLVNTGTATNPVLKVGDLSGNALATQVTNLSAQQAQLMGVAATIDELTVSHVFPGSWETGVWSASGVGAAVIPIWVAPYACTIASASLVMHSTGVPMDATNYVWMTLGRNRAATITDIVKKQSSAEAITAMVPWSFAGAAWDTTAATFQAGDVLTVFTNGAGTAKFTWPVALTVQVQPS